MMGITRKEWVLSPSPRAPTPTHNVHDSHLPTQPCRHDDNGIVYMITLQLFIKSLLSLLYLNIQNAQICPSKYNPPAHTSSTTTMFLFGGSGKEVSSSQEQQQQRQQQQQQRLQRQTSPSRRGQTQQTAEEQKSQAEKEAHSKALLLMNAEQRGFLSYEVCVCMYAGTSSCELHDDPCL